MVPHTQQCDPGADVPPPGRPLRLGPSPDEVAFDALASEAVHLEDRLHAAAGLSVVCTLHLDDGTAQLALPTSLLLQTIGARIDHLNDLASAATYRADVEASTAAAERVDAMMATPAAEPAPRPEAYVLLTASAPITLVGPFDTEANAGDWGRAWQKSAGDNPCWQVVTLAPGQARLHIAIPGETLPDPNGTGGVS
jgi:hypothetical protein